MKHSLKEAYRFLFEQDEEPAAQPPPIKKTETDEKPRQKLSNLFKKSYPEFVPFLAKLTMDADFMNSLEGDGSGEDKLTVQTITVRCGDLIPLQNEIGVKESLDYALKCRIPRENIIKICGTSECSPNVYDSKGRTVITSGGKYIVDGHHRWSSIFVINPDCLIQVKDIGKYKKGVDALKLSQIIIAVLSKAKGEIGSKKAKGINLLDTSASDLKKHIEENITDEFVHAYIEANTDEDGENLGEGFENKEQVIEKILSYCLKLQALGIDPDAVHNERGIMPQYDDAGTYLSRAQQGEVNISDIKIAMNENKRQIERWKKLAGLL
jgi:hypothetical protein